MSITSMILNSQNEIEELNESETKFNEAVDSYVYNNAARVSNLPEYKSFEQAHRGMIVCEQLEKVAQKGKAEFAKTMQENKKLLDAQVNGEVKRYAFVEEVKLGFKTPLTKVALAFLVPAFLFFVLTKVQHVDAEAVASTVDTGTAVEVQVPKA